MRIARRILDALRHPRRLVAFVRRVAQVVARGELTMFLGRLRPRGATSGEYAAWLARQRPTQVYDPPSHLVALDFDDTFARLQPRPAQATCVVVRAKGGGWSELSGGEVLPLSTWVERCGAAWIWWVAAPLRFFDDAAGAIARGCRHPAASIVYADYECVDEQGRPTPLFNSAWDRIRIAEQPYPAPLIVAGARFAAAIDGASGDPVVAQWRMLLGAVDAVPEREIVHVPRIVARLDRPVDVRTKHAADAVRADIERLARECGVAATVDAERAPSVVYRTRESATVSIVIPTRDRADLLERCLRSIVDAGSSAEVDVVVVDNGSTDAGVDRVIARFAATHRVRTLRMDVPFNFPLLCNAGVEASQGRVVVLLNNDTQVTASWLDELVPLAMRTDVGAVGPLVVYPDGAIQSAGVIVGANRTATSALEGFDPRSAVAQAWCSARRRVTAVLGACMAIRRDHYRDVGGMDPRFAVSHNEVDLCLRLERRGLGNVFTPFAKIVHVEGATRGFEVTSSERERLLDEERAFTARWRRVLDAADRAHHPAYARTGNPFLLDASIETWAPRAGWHADADSPRHARTDG